MKTCCLVCKNYTDNNNSRFIKKTQSVQCVKIKKICLLQRGMVYLII